MPNLTNPDLGMREMLLGLWSHLSKQRKSQLACLLVVMLLSSGAEVLSLAAVLPFLAVLADPATLWEQPLIQELAIKVGITTPQELLLPVTIAFAFASIFSGAIRLLNQWLNRQLAAAIGSDLSCEVYRRTLYQPYSTHLKRNSSIVIATINGDVEMVIGGVLNPLLQLISSGLIVLSLVCTLLAIDLVVAIGAGFAIVLVYSFAIGLGHKPLKRQGTLRAQLNRMHIQALQEGLGAIRDVLLNGSQNFYTSQYRKADLPMRLVSANTNFLTSYPRLVMEPAGMALIALLGFLLIQQGSVVQALPMLGALALGAQKLLPMAQKVYEGLALGQNAKTSMYNVLLLLNQELPAIAALPNAAALQLKKTIRFEDLTFSYGTDISEVLSEMNLEIIKGQRIGFIGNTGSGKSTTMDLLMGLLKPTSGKILIDGNDLHDPRNPLRVASWRSAIAHVPQSIYLSDSSIAENIGFGLPSEMIDMKRVKMAAEQAQIAGFIESIHDGYESFVGERGVRLSGGQRQRIGIARALYRQAQILVLDEATSALDNETEEAVMSAIDGLDRSLTVLLIAHRLTTVARCDRVIRLDKGKVVSDGSPNSILGINRDY